MGRMQLSAPTSTFTLRRSWWLFLEARCEGLLWLLCGHVCQCLHIPLKFLFWIVLEGIFPMDLSEFQHNKLFTIFTWVYMCGLESRLLNMWVMLLFLWFGCLLLLLLLFFWHFSLLLVSSSSALWAGFTSVPGVAMVCSSVWGSTGCSGVSHVLPIVGPTTLATLYIGSRPCMSCHRFWKEIFCSCYGIGWHLSRQTLWLESCGVLPVFFVAVIFCQSCIMALFYLNACHMVSMLLFPCPGVDSKIFVYMNKLIYIAWISAALVAAALFR